MSPSWRQRQKEELRRQLYEAALELFQSNGYESTSVQQITDQVGVAKGTFFNHFPTKEHVVAEWYNQLTFDSLEAARQRSAKNAEEVICELLVDMAKRAMAAPELLLAKSRHSSHPLLIEAEKVQDEEIDAFVLQACLAGKKSGEFDPELDEDFFVDLLGVMLTGSSRAWVSARRGEGQALEDLALEDLATVVDRRLRFLFHAAKPTA